METEKLESTPRPSWLPHWQGMVATIIATIVLAAATSIITANAKMAVQESRLSTVETKVAGSEAKIDQIVPEPEAVRRSEMMARFDALTKQNDQIQREVAEMRTGQAETSRQMTEVYKYILALKR